MRPSPVLLFMPAKYQFMLIRIITKDIMPHLASVLSLLDSNFNFTLQRRNNIYQNKNYIFTFNMKVKIKTENTNSDVAWLIT